MYLKYSIFSYTRAYVKHVDLTKLYGWGLLGILLLIVVHAPLTVMLGTAFPEYNNLLRSWKEIALALLAMIAVVLVTRRKLWSKLLHDPLILLSLTYIDIHLLLAVAFGGDANSLIAGLMIDLRFVAMFLLAYVLGTLWPDVLPKVARVTAAGAAIVLGFGLLQITVLPDDVLRHIGYAKDVNIAPFITIDRNPDFVRINSTLRGPNPLGALTIVYAALVVAYLIRRNHTARLRRKVIAASTGAASVAVLFATYSRSAYGAFVAALAVAAVAGSRLTKRFVVLGVAGLIVVAGALALLSSSDWYSNVILHEDPESPVATKSNDEHVASLAEGSSRMMRQPFGAGIGSTGSASLYDKDVTNDIVIENYYLFVAHEAGWIGLAVFIALFVTTLVALWRRRDGWMALGLLASGVGLGLIGLLLPIWNDDTIAIIWWGLSGVVLGVPRDIIGGRHGRTTRKQKATGTT